MHHTLKARRNMERLLHTSRHSKRRCGKLLYLIGEYHVALGLPRGNPDPEATRLVKPRRVLTLSELRQAHDMAKQLAKEFPKPAHISDIGYPY